MGKNTGNGRGGYRDFGRIAERVMTSKITQKAMIHGIINAIGGPEAFCRNFALDYESAKAGSAARVRMNTTILSALGALQEDDASAAMEDFDELKEFAQRIIDGEFESGDDGEGDGSEDSEEA